MPRKPRLTIPGALHHIMARGIDGCTIFNDDEHRNKFLFLLSEAIALSGFKCYAWVLMDNHYHLLLRINENSLGFFMRSLNSKYARWFRKLNKGKGYLFQDRYKSIVTQDQDYIEELVRYIHLNPHRAGICKTIKQLDKFPWSGHAVLVGTKYFQFQDTIAVLNRFGKNRLTAIEGYREFIQQRIQNKKDHKLMEILERSNTDSTNRHDPNCWVIGDQSFVKTALDRDHTNRLQISYYRKHGWTVQRIVSEVAQQMDIDTDEILKRARGNERSRFRKIVAALSHRTCGIPIIEIARYYGVGASSVSRMLDEGERFAKGRNITLKQ